MVNSERTRLYSALPTVEEHVSVKLYMTQYFVFMLRDVSNAYFQCILF